MQKNAENKQTNKPSLLVIETSQQVTSSTLILGTRSSDVFEADVFRDFGGA